MTKTVSGIMPGERKGDALIFQYLNNVAFDYDKVQTCTPMAGGILDCSRGCDPNEAI
jgi:hypothetical protein